MRLILASKSPRRIELLKKLGKEFEIIPSQAPEHKADALRILKKLNASWQTVYTGICIICLAEQKMLYGHDMSKCKARRLSTKELEELAGKHMDKAGAYAVQDKDDRFIEKIVGSRTNVVGFPVEFFEKLFKEFLA